MFDYERFQILLRGDDSPQNDEEQSWLDNYNKQSRESLKIFQEKERQQRLNQEMAYKEFIALFDSTCPENLRCKNPVSLEELDKIQKSLHNKVDKRVQRKMHSPEYMIRFLFHPQIGDHIKAMMQNGLYNCYMDEETCKYFNVSYESVRKQYESYMTKGMKSKYESIEKKYGVHLMYGLFNVDYWCTDYARYREYKA